MDAPPHFKPADVQAKRRSGWFGPASAPISALLSVEAERVEIRNCSLAHPPRSCCRQRSLKNGRHGLVEA